MNKRLALKLLNMPHEKRRGLNWRRGTRLEAARWLTRRQIGDLQRYANRLIAQGVIKA